MPGSDIPVIRQPWTEGDRLPMWASGFRNAGDHHCYDLDVDHHCYDLDVDPDEQENRAGEAMEAEMLDLLRAALDDVDAPGDQYERLGLGRA